MAKIATTATIEPQAILSDDVEIGPGCYVGPKVTLGPGCRLQANVTITGNTTIGRNNVFYPSCVMGAPPQDLKYNGTDTQLIIGDDNIFRENVTAHTGTEVAGGITEIGSHNQFQVGTHIAHDVKVGNHCIVSNLVQIAGHVHIEDHVTISGLVGVQQFVTLGKFCFISGMARCTIDTPPYVIYGHEGTVQGINFKGLGRWGFTEQCIQQLRDICKRLYPRRGESANGHRFRALYRILPVRREEPSSTATLAKRIQEVESTGITDEHCRYLIEFLKRSIQYGVHGRFLESLRRDSQAMPAKFYRLNPAGVGGSSGGNGL